MHDLAEELSAEAAVQHNTADILAISGDPVFQSRAANLGVRGHHGTDLRHDVQSGPAERSPGVLETAQHRVDFYSNHGFHRPGTNQARRLPRVLRAVQTSVLMHLQAAAAIHAAGEVDETKARGALTVHDYDLRQVHHSDDKAGEGVHS